MSDVWLSIIGIGEDGLNGLSLAAREALFQAQFVVGGARHLALVAPLEAEALVWPVPIEAAYPKILAQRGRPVVILASGDPFFYGIGSVLAKQVSPSEMTCFPQASSMSLAAAKMGWGLQECAIVSLHGRALEKIIPHLHPARKIIALTWDGTTPEKLAHLLTARGMGASKLTVLSRLGGAHEKIERTTARDFALNDIDPLNLVAVELIAEPKARIVPLSAGLPDEWFLHDGQITKRDTRAMTLGALAPRHGELLWDIGAGSGSISIEWMLCHDSLRAIAIEQNADRAKNIRANALSLGVPDLEIIEGAAPAALKGLPAPDAVFIGGGATIEGVFEAAWSALKSGGRMVINAVTLETQAQLTALFKAHGGRADAAYFAEADPVGRFHGWRASMPVVMWQVTKSELPK